jgi:hypothetical protein
MYIGAGLNCNNDMIRASAISDLSLAKPRVRGTFVHPTIQSSFVSTLFLDKLSPPILQ